MSSIMDKIHGITNQIVGRLKEETGKLTENEYLEAEGLAQHLRGKAQQTAGILNDAVKNGIDRL